MDYIFFETRDIRVMHFTKDVARMSQENSNKSQDWKTVESSPKKYSYIKYVVINQPKLSFDVCSFLPSLFILGPFRLEILHGLIGSRDCLSADNLKGTFSKH